MVPESELPAGQAAPGVDGLFRTHWLEPQT